MFRIVGSVVFHIGVASEFSALFQTTIGADGSVKVDAGLQNMWTDHLQEQFAAAVCGADPTLNKTEGCASLVTTVLDTVKTTKDPTGWWLKTWIESTIASIEPMRADALPYSTVYRQCISKCHGLGAVIAAYASLMDLNRKMFPTRWYGKVIPAEIKREDQDKAGETARRLKQEMCAAFEDATCKLDDMPAACTELREKAGIPLHHLEAGAERCSDINAFKHCDAVCPDAKDKFMAAFEKWREGQRVGGTLTSKETLDLCHEGAPALACHQKPQCEDAVNRYFPDISSLQEKCENAFT